MRGQGRVLGDETAGIAIICCCLSGRPNHGMRCSNMPSAQRSGEAGRRETMTRNGREFLLCLHVVIKLGRCEKGV